MYAVTWAREKKTDLISLVGADGKPFPYKPGQTWFEVIGASSTFKNQGELWRFDFNMAP
jgi:hypothetical protein